MEALKHLISFIHSERGQSVVEFAVCAPALVLLLFAIIYMSDLYIVKSKVIVSARYGAWHLARNERNQNVNQNDIENRIRENFFFSYGQTTKPWFSTLVDNQSVTALSFVNDDSDWEFSCNSNIVGSITQGVDSLITGALGGLLGGDSETTFFQVHYSAPLNFGPISLSINAADIKGFHAVDGNSWNGCAVDVHDLFDMIFQPISNFFGGGEDGRDEQEDTPPDYDYQP